VRIQSFQNGGVAIAAGTLDGTNLIVQNNHTFGSGGGIGVFSPGVLGQLNNVSLIGNFADGSGGGLYRDPISVGNSNITNGTISGNQAGLGGGIFMGTDGDYLQLHWSVIGSNHAFSSGGGIYVASNCSSGSALTIYDSVVEGNSADGGGQSFYADCPGFANSIYTLWGSPLDGFINDINMDAGSQVLSQATIQNDFSPLSNTGAPYFLPVYVPTSTSDARNMAQCPGPVDVRGVARPQGPGCDVGAWEVL
jgi:fibronectin-binding autotransporter adhesin